MTKSFGEPVAGNRLLASLSPDLFGAIAPHLDLLQLEQGLALEYPQKLVEQIVFPVSCVCSMVAVGDQGRRIEVGLFGFEGMSGTTIVTGAETSPLEVFVQIAGEGHVIGREVFRGLLDAHGGLETHFMRYIHCLNIQTAQTALSNGQAKLEERLARWLLMCHDRIVGDRMELTHEFLSVMLGVRRAGVTVGTHLLEGKGLIRAERGVITVLDREGLEAEARGTFGPAEKEYLRLFGPVRAGR
ncbi:Crp/Fnr family transcriptional regulator [Celeribacter indicus]|uniref:Crp/FNR family transcriptional regulator n=1 Tax=Celeribacter indicus TaxID=1208324 RepID=A0A0B5E1C7_9RHOB|nr:Crp/Fnr family transcriptional regulator [Celeribacter indicus]AJE47195.1 Crp/FNR family transcriptional regulator [Celeribacter indicus]SDW00429.1 cAMP-binding domain of CRP or a regulatory subunit of cAMP-dependent protein kinases [Celeribacter indicus]